MNNDTVELLKESSSGCEMAIESIRQVKEYAKDESLKTLLDDYENKHDKLYNRIENLLSREGYEPKEPGKMATAMAWANIEIKMLFEADNHQIASIMMDGCNMGIKSLSEYINKYGTAAPESQKAAKELVQIEEEFMKKLKDYV